MILSVRLTQTKLQQNQRGCVALGRCNGKKVVMKRRGEGAGGAAKGAVNDLVVSEVHEL